MSYYPKSAKITNKNNRYQDQVKSEQDDISGGQLYQSEENHQGSDEIFESVSSEEDKDRLKEEMKKREDFYKTINQTKFEAPENLVNTFEGALEIASKTNKKMLMLRKMVQISLERMKRKFNSFKL